MIIENPLNPAASNQISLAGGNHECIALHVRIANPKVEGLVARFFLAKPAERVIDSWAAAIEIPIHDQTQHLMMPGSPVVFGERVQIRQVVVR